ncbi:TniQ family protein [Trinickia sp. NRRL B-1857]|uniref:TniQ family protein n=1 Tax=Trinickia sp. NRRL B-1857 TaxID=3162879 RepID=UPI003D264D79
MNNRPASILVAPQPIEDESPASWILRTCQTHSVKYQELLEHLGIPQCRDPDVCLPVDYLCRIGHGTRVAEKRLRSLGSVFKAVRELPELKALLIFDAGGRPAYRVCALCLSHDEVPYLRIQWRFKDWNYCPVHHIALTWQCPECRSSIIGTKVSLGHSPNGDPSDISHCYHCGQPRARGSLAHSSATFDDRELAAQNFLVSAVLHGYFLIEGFDRQVDLGFLLWLRENYPWDLPHVAPTICGATDTHATRFIVRQILRDEQRASRRGDFRPSKGCPT